MALLGFLQKWHRWLGLSVVPVFLVTSITGVLLVFQKDIIRLTMTPGAEIPSGYSVDDMSEDLTRLLAHHDYRPEALIKAPNPEEPYWWIRFPTGEKWLYQIQTLEKYDQNEWVLNFLEFTRHLHLELWLGLAGEIFLLYVAAMVFLLAASGAVLWWPMRAGFKWSWVFPPRRRWKLKSFLRFHSQSGILIVVTLLVVTATASVMMWNKVNNALAANTNVEESAYYTSVSAKEMSEALLIALNAVPGSTPTYIRQVSGEKPVARIRVRLQDEWHPNGRTNIYIDLDSMKITNLQHAHDVTVVRRLLNQMYPLHSSYGMPWFYSLLIFVTGVGAFWMIVTGAGSWLRRRTS